MSDADLIQRIDTILVQTAVSILDIDAPDIPIAMVRREAIIDVIAAVRQFDAAQPGPRAVAEDDFSFFLSEGFTLEDAYDHGYCSADDGDDYGIAHELGHRTGLQHVETLVRLRLAAALAQDGGT